MIAATDAINEFRQFITKEKEKYKSPADFIVEYVTRFEREEEGNLEFTIFPHILDLLQHISKGGKHILHTYSRSGKSLLAIWLSVYTYLFRDDLEEVRVVVPTHEDVRWMNSRISEAIRFVINLSGAPTSMITSWLSSNAKGKHTSFSHIPSLAEGEGIYIIPTIMRRVDTGYGQFSRVEERTLLIVDDMDMLSKDGDERAAFNRLLMECIKDPLKEMVMLGTSTTPNTLFSFLVTAVQWKLVNINLIQELKARLSPEFSEYLRELEDRLG